MKSIGETVLVAGTGTESSAPRSVAERAARHWGYDAGCADTHIELMCVSENVTYLLTAAGTPARVLRLNRPGYHSRQAIDSELAWTQALRRDGVASAPEAVPALDGRLVATLEGAPAQYASMFAHVPGQPPHPASPVSGMHAIGALAARLHAHARSWIRPAGFTRFAWDLPAALGSVDAPGRWGPWRAAAPRSSWPVLSAAEARVREELGAYGQDARRFGLVHGDLRVANLLVDSRDTESAGVTVLDFDDCGFSWFLYDLAASMSFVEHAPDLGARVADWLDGYRTGGQLDRCDPRCAAGAGDAAPAAAARLVGQPRRYADGALARVRVRGADRRRGASLPARRAAAVAALRTPYRVRSQSR